MNDENTCSKTMIDYKNMNSLCQGMSQLPRETCQLFLYSVSHNFIAPSKELYSKMDLGEVGVSLP